VEQQQFELIGTVRFQPGRLKGARVSGAQIAGLIDELPVLAAIGPFTEEGIEIRDARELRVKESDRIGAVVKNLRAMGATVEEFEDGLRVPGGQKLHGAEIETFGDHRIAMAFSVAALRAEGETLIKGADCVAVSYPAFYEHLDRLIAG
jgi:3-phosphoshikimate 1-carboxyvinyltransferase